MLGKSKARHLTCGFCQRAYTLTGKNYNLVNTELQKKPIGESLLPMCFSHFTKYYILTNVHNRIEGISHEYVL